MITNVLLGKLVKAERERKLDSMGSLVCCSVSRYGK